MWHVFCDLMVKNERNMKKLISLLVAVLCLSTANACMKKSNQQLEISLQPLTVIVMDTTQALLDGAEIKAGKQVFKTSFDGRVLLKPEQLAGIKSLTISREGYESAKFVLDSSPLAIVALTPKPLRPGKDDKVVAYGLGTMRGERSSVMYMKAAAMPSAAMEDGVIYEEEVAEFDMAADREVAMPGGYAPNNAVSAGKLTAGEVNDFTKWYFWPSVMDGSHKSFVQEWKIAPRHRYTVQVRTQAGLPIVSRAVSLLDTNGNTLFQAVTDNTGKAELWYQLIGNNLCGKHAEFQIRVDEQVQTAKDWSEGLNTFVLDEGCEANEAVDVLFVFDATGSMGDELRYLQAEMKDVISRAKEATGGLAIRTGAVVYRDHGDEYITRISRLTDDIKTTQSFIDKQEANGGGDYPEAVPEALMAAMNSTGWNESARARIAFLILDAPCHKDSTTIALLHEQVLNAAALGVRIVPVVCSGLGESGEYLLRSIALATNGTSFFLTDDSGIGHTHLKPTTDSLKVEHLNDMLVRTIVEFSAMPECDPAEVSDPLSDDVAQFLPNPFKAEDIERDPSIPHGEGVHYLMDVSGKLITIFEGETAELQAQIVRMGLPVGVYFIKTFSGGEWHTEKMLER